MGRPKKVINLDGPKGEFACGLRHVRIDAAEPPYRAMAKATGCAHTRLSQADRGHTFPTWPTTKAYLRACGVEDKVITQHWRPKWEETKRAIARKAETDRSPKAT